MTSSEHETDEDVRGVAFPRGVDGRRGSSATCQAVFVDALAAASTESAARASVARPWRVHYPSHVRELVRLSLADPAAAVSTARAGLASAHQRLEFLRGADVVPLARFEDVEVRRPLGSVELKGRGAQSPRALEIPYRGERLAGDRLDRQLDRWQDAGIVEASHAQAIREVASRPEWLDLSDRTFVLLGASAGIGPLSWLAGWRARIVAIDVPQAQVWERIARCVHEGNGSLLAPIGRTDAPGADTRGPGPGPGRERGARAGTWDAETPARAGADLLADLPEIAQWLAAIEGPITVGAYAYMDGGAHVRISAAMDALTHALLRRRQDVSLAMLATPTDVYAVPADAVRESRRRHDGRGPAARAWQRPIALASAGRLFRPNYATQAAPSAGAAHGGPPIREAASGATGERGICDSLVLQQGANYALAKRLQQWRALAARDDGVRVSINVAPSTTTPSVVKNPALAAAFAGAHHFGVESFGPETTSALMAALLVYDLRSGRSPADPAVALEHPLDLLTHGANHGGMWRMPFVARSALPFAAALGWMRGPRSR